MHLEQSYLLENRSCALGALGFTFWAFRFEFVASRGWVWRDPRSEGAWQIVLPYSFSVRPHALDATQKASKRRSHCAPFNFGILMRWKNRKVASSTKTIVALTQAGVIAKALFAPGVFALEPVLPGGMNQSSKCGFAARLALSEG